MFYKKNGEKLALEGIFSDEGITGTKKKNRKAFEYMMRCAEDGEFDVIFCKNVQRFTRNIADGQNALKRLKQLGINVYFEDGGLNYFEHEDIINLFMSIAQAESRMKSAAVQFGIKKAQQQGKWTSNCPYGYDRVDGYLKINQREAEVVRKIYDLYLNEGFGHKRICDYLTENNIPTKKGGRWYTQHVRNILSNPLYSGVQITNKTVNMDVNVLNIKEVPEEEWIIHEKEELRIIPKDIWQRVQDMAEKKLKNMKSSNRPSSINLFSTIVRCGNCGGILRRKRKRTKIREGNGKYNMIWLDEYEWVCQNNDLRGVKVCSYRNAIDESVLLDFVKKEILNYRNLTEIYETLFRKYIQKNFTYDENELNNINNEILELKQDFENKLRLNGKGLITDDELSDFTKSYRENLANLERRKLKINNVVAEIEQKKREYEDFIKYLKNVDINNLTNTDLKKLFSRLVVDTRDDMLKENGELNDEYDVLEGYPYMWFNQSKKTVKILTANFMFMDQEREKILFS